LTDRASALFFFVLNCKKLYKASRAFTWL